LAILAVSFAQDAGGGCCFYSQKNFEGESFCSSQPFKHTIPVQSFFCTEKFAANLMKNKQIQAPALCNDNLPETSRPIEVDEIHVFTPCPRFSDCCFYTENNLAGEEYCIPTSRAPNPPKVFKSYTCLPGWKPRIAVEGAVDLPCPQSGVAVSFATPINQDNIDVVGCATGAPAEGVEDIGQGVFLEENFAVDPSVQVDFPEVINEQINIETDSLAVDSGSEEPTFFDDGALAIEEPTFIDDGALAIEEPTFIDDGALAVEETNFVDFSTEGSESNMGADNTNGSSAIVASLVCVVLAVLSVF